jgi:hypothetical protein
MKAWLVYVYEKMPDYVLQLNPHDDSGYFFTDENGAFITNSIEIKRLEGSYWADNLSPFIERAFWSPAKTLSKAFHNEEHAKHHESTKMSEGFTTSIIEIEIE